MSEDSHTRISELLDHENGSGEMDSLLEALTENPDLRRKAIRYRMIGDVMRGERISVDTTELIGNIRDRVSAEPAIVAPHPVSAPRTVSPALRITAGVAIAATVAAVAIALFPRAVDPVSEPAPTVALAPGLPGTQPGPSVTVAMPSAPTSEPNNSQMPSWDRYLMDHGAFAGQGLVRGVRPHPALVAFDGR